MEMENSSLLNNMMLKLRASCKYYTGYPKDLGPSRVLHFTSEREFVQLLHQGHPIVVAFTIKCNLTKHLDNVMEEAAAEFYPHVKFMRVECPKYPGFCITRQKSEYPFLEVFHSPEQAVNQGKAIDPNITKYSVKVLPFNYDLSTYGLREFFKRYGVRSSDSKPTAEKLPEAEYVLKNLYFMELGMYGVPATLYLSSILRFTCMGTKEI